MAVDMSQTLQLPSRPGHSYTGNKAEGSSTQHYGDNYVINGEPAEHLDFNGHYSSTVLRPVNTYVERPALHAQLRTRLHDTIEERGKGHNSKTLAICGLGGAGKSQLMLSYITAYRGDYTAVFWLDAGSKANLDADYKRLRNVLHRSKRADMDVETCVAEVKEWCHRKPGRWLFVFDSADDVESSNSAAYIDLQRYLVDVASADVVVTTRSQSVQEITGLEAVQVADLTPAEARNLFLKRSKLSEKSPGVDAKVDEITKELGFFALAVNLAAAYVAETPRLRSNPERYLLEYRKRQGELLARMPKPLVDQYRASVLTTWETSYAAILEKCPEACKLLTWLAFLDPDNISLPIFDVENQAVATTLPAILFVESSSSSLQDVLDTGFETLRAYSLVPWRDEQQSHSMHKLVHTWSYERLGEDARSAYCTLALAFLDDYGTSVVSEPALHAGLAPHIMACFTRARELCSTEDAAKANMMKSLERLAADLANAGLYKFGYEVQHWAAGYRYLQRSVDPYAYIKSRYILGRLMTEIGSYHQAAETLHCALNESKELFGPDQEMTLEIALTLGHTLMSCGKHGEAEGVLRWAPTRQGAWHGSDRLRYLTMSRLGGLLSYQEMAQAEAKELSQRAVNGLGVLLGPSHRKTIATTAVLGSLLITRSNYDEAGELLRPLLMRGEVIFGPHHPVTLSIMLNLGIARGFQGAYEEAEKLIRQALDGFEKSLGPRDVDTLNSAWDLAFFLTKQQKYHEALALYQKALEEYTEIYGSADSETLKLSTEVSNLSRFLE